MYSDMSYPPNITGSAFKIMCCLFFVVFLGTPAKSGSQPLPGNIKIEEGGEIWIEGTAGPVNFSCHAEELSGRGKIENIRNPKTNVTGEGQINISVSLPVKSLNCGKRAMNKDMYNALKAEKFKDISYQVLKASQVENSHDALSKNGSWINIRTQGIMEIAGVQDTTTVDVQGNVFGDNQFRVKGSKKIHMDTFDIKPPSKMFGIIRANKELTVHFDVTVTLEDPPN